MFPYILLILIPFYFETIERILKPFPKNPFTTRNSNKSIIIFFIIFFFVLALRSTSCGNDVKVYEYYFKMTENLDFIDLFNDQAIEPLYLVLNWVVLHIYPDYRIFLAIVAFLSCFFTGWFYAKKSEDAFLTIILFATNTCFTIVFSGLRQGLAMQFIIPAYYLTMQKKIIPFLLTVFVAYYIHSSALIILLLYPVFHLPIKNKHFPIIIFVVLFFFILKKQIFSVVFPFLIGRYSKYSVLRETGSFAVYLFFLICLIISFIYPDEKKISSEIRGLRNVMALMTVIQCFSAIHTLAMRMNYYFIMLFPIIIPKILNIPKKGNENFVKATKCVFVLFLTFFFFYTVCSNMGVKTIFPYRAYWE